MRDPVPWTRQPVFRSTHALAVVALASVIVFWRTLHNGLALDDAAVLSNPLLADSRSLFRLLTSPWWYETGRLYRPLTLFSFGVERALAPERIWLLHAVNLVLHAVIAVLLTRLLLRVLPLFAACGAGLLFAVLPVHAEAVGSVVGRAELVSATALLGLMLLVTGSRPPSARLQLYAALLGAAALGAKEGGVMAPAVAFLAAWAVPTQRRHAARWAGAALAGTVLLLAARVGVLGTFGGDLPNPAFRILTVESRLALALSVLPRAAAMLFLPVPPAIDYVPTMAGVLHPDPRLVALGAALVLGAVAALVVHLRRPSVAALGVCVAAITLAPSANLFFASGVVLSGRTLYSATIGAALVMGAVLAWLLGTRVRALAAVSMGALVAASAVVAWRESIVWRDTATVIHAMRQRHPDAYRSHLLLGYAARDAGEPALAVKHFRRAADRFAGDSEMLTDAATVALRLSDTVTARAWLEAAIAVNPRAARARTRLFAVVRASGDTAAAYRLLADGVRLLPEQRLWRQMVEQRATSVRGRVD